MICNLNLQDIIYAIGMRTDIPRLMSAADIYVSSSLGEAFPNVIGEAMASETPCVVTGVGDCAYMIGKTGFVAESENVSMLGEKIEKMLVLEDCERNELGRLARIRIVEEFEIKKIVSCYEKLYQ